MAAGTRMTLAEVINSDIQSTKSLADEDVQIVKPRFPLRND
jgi:hypothetical protein